jgi:hypothetical protein
LDCAFDDIYKESLDHRSDLLVDIGFNNYQRSRPEQVTLINIRKDRFNDSPLHRSHLGLACDNGLRFAWVKD